MEMDPYIIVAQRIFEALAESFIGAIRLAGRLIVAPFKIVYNFITENKNE